MACCISKYKNNENQYIYLSHISNLRFDLTIQDAPLVTSWRTMFVYHALGELTVTVTIGRGVLIVHENSPQTHQVEPHAPIVTYQVRFSTF